jgi:hypothetical protein
VTFFQGEHRLVYTRGKQWMTTIRKNMSVSTHEHIHSILDEVWSILNHAGISKDLVIIESIAALLLEIEQRRACITELQPRRPEINENTVESLKQYLIVARDLAQSSWALFDRYILFRLSVKPEKNTYPIPRHITRFMIQILNLSLSHSFADFTCGSGGFLVHEITRSDSRVGIDISPEWLRIAAANITLQPVLAFNKPILYEGDAFHICNGGKLASQSFDRIAMAPPFGTIIDPEVALQTMGVTSRRTSEILFIRLALKKLNEQGRGVVMVPDTLLTKRGNQQLKKEILERHTLLAVISLGEGALYPFDPQSVSILLLEKHHNPISHLWLFNVVNDGYPRRRNRDITQDPSPEHDLAIVESALRAESSLQPIPTKNGTPAYFAVAALQSNNQDTFIGFVIRTRVSVKQYSIWLLEEEQPELATRRFLLAHLSTSDTIASTQYIVVPLNQVGMQFTDIRCGDNYTTWLSNRSQIRSGSTLFSHSDEAGMISPTVAVLSDGRLLGCTRSADEIIHDGYRLHPSDYLHIVGQRRSLNTVELLKYPQTDQRDQTKSLSPPHGDDSRNDRDLNSDIDGHRYPQDTLLSLQERSFESEQNYPEVTQQLDSTESLSEPPNSKNDDHHKLVEELRRTPTGDGKAYEELVKKILEYCFIGEFSPFQVKEQVRTDNGKRIRDFIIDNRSPKMEFWQSLKPIRGVEKILFDTKNYKDPVEYAQISSTLRYLKNKAFGNFIIIISRHGVKDYEESLEDYLAEGRVVLFLDDASLVKMINLKREGKSPTLLIEEKYHDLLDMR